jgi:hypothetical protein
MRYDFADKAIAGKFTTLWQWKDSQHWMGDLCKIPVNLNHSHFQKMMVRFIVILRVLTFGFVRCATSVVIDGFFWNTGVLEMSRKVGNEYLQHTHGQIELLIRMSIHLYFLSPRN